MTDTPQSAPARRATSDDWTAVERAGAALNGTATRAFRWSADAIMKLLVPLAILALVMGFARIVLDLGKVYRTPSITAGFEILVTDILSMFVVIELLKSIVEYFEAHRLKLTFIVDGALVFVLREVMIALYQHAASPGQLGALAAILLVLGLLRAGAVLYSPERRAHVADADDR